MTKDECKKLVLDIIADIAPDEDLSNVKPDVRLRVEHPVHRLEVEEMDQEIADARHGRLEVHRDEPDHQDQDHQAEPAKV